MSPEYKLRIQYEWKSRKSGNIPSRREWQVRPQLGGAGGRYQDLQLNGFLDKSWTADWSLPIIPLTFHTHPTENCT